MNVLHLKTTTYKRSKCGINGNDISIVMKSTWLSFIIIAFDKKLLS